MKSARLDTSDVRLPELLLPPPPTKLTISTWSPAPIVVWPNAVPNIFAGLRISLPIAIAVAVVTELISSNRGLGYLVQMGAMNFDITEVFAAILGATVLVLAVGYGVDGTEAMLLRWRPSGDPLQQQQATSTT